MKSGWRWGHSQRHPCKASGRVCTLSSSLPVVAPHGPAYPAAEGRHPGVDAGRLLRPAGVAPRRDPVNHPASPRTLAHQRASAVTAATVHAALWVHAAGTEHAAGESAVEVLLAVAAGQQRDGRLLQGLGVRAAWRRRKRLFLNTIFKIESFVCCLFVFIRCIFFGGEKLGTWSKTWKMTGWLFCLDLHYQVQRLC